MSYLSSQVNINWEDRHKSLVANEFAGNSKHKVKAEKEHELPPETQVC